MEGSCPGERPSGDENAFDHPMGIRFCAILYLQMSGANGTVQVLNGKMLKLDGADSAVLLLAAATSFEGPLVKPSESTLDPVTSAFTTLNMARSMSYSQLKAYHIDDYQSLFQRVSLQLSRGSNDIHVLGGSTSAHSPDNISQDTVVSDCAVQMADCSRLRKLNNSEKPTVDRIISFLHDEDPSLVELLFQFGRYLLISCSRPGTQISNLQGIWSNDTKPPWEYVRTTYLVLICCLLQLYINILGYYWFRLLNGKQLELFTWVMFCRVCVFRYIVSLKWGINSQRLAL